MAENEKPIAVPVPAATILLLRDVPGGLEVFMVKRHHQIDFVAGALVFPGGKVEKGDSDAALKEFFDGGEAWTDAMRALGAGAIREAFEESGILLARDARHGDFVSGERLAELQHYRPLLDKREAVLADVLRKEKLRLALDQLVHFAHWTTPANMPKRFDTHFFLAEMPTSQEAAYDHLETSDGVWITPEEASAGYERGDFPLVFAQIHQLRELHGLGSFADARARFAGHAPRTIMPRVVQRDGKPVILLPDEE